jgi:adenylylsulfate kinase
VNEFGGTAVAACISPYQEIRDENRKLIGNFVEVYCECPIEVLKERDVKGLYAKAARGEVKDFTGVHKSKHAGYEPPTNPEVVVSTDRESVEESLAKIVSTLEELGYLPRLEVYSEGEEKTIRKRLESLGYL